MKNDWDRGKNVFSGIYYWSFLVSLDAPEKIQWYHKRPDIVTKILSYCVCKSVKKWLSYNVFKKKCVAGWAIIPDWKKIKSHETCIEVYHRMPLIKTNILSYYSFRLIKNWLRNLYLKQWGENGTKIFKIYFYVSLDAPEQN